MTKLNITNDRPKNKMVGDRTPKDWRQKSSPITALFEPVQLSKNLQIFDLKQLADMEAQYKAQCKAALAAYKAWQDLHAGETDIIALLYGNLEGTMLKRRAHDAVEAYWVIRLDFRKWFKRYLAENCCYPTRYRGAGQKNSEINSIFKKGGVKSLFFKTNHHNIRGKLL